MAENPKHKLNQEQVLEVIDDMYLTLGGKEELTNLAEKAGKQHTTEIFFVDFLMELTDIDIDTATLVVEKLVDEYELNYDANFDDLKNEEEVEQYKKEFPERYENSGEYDYIESIINNDK